MKNSIILHGTCDKEEYYSDEYPSLSNSHWLPWIQKQLLMKDILAQTPEMPAAYAPDYDKWKGEFERFDVDGESILIGHSCGGGFLVRWLSENKINIDKLILVAPWLDPDRRKTSDFFDFDIDKNILDRIKEIHLFVSEDDDRDILESVEIIKKEIAGIQIHEFKDKGHFCFGDMKTDKFHELLNII